MVFSYFLKTSFLLIQKELLKQILENMEKWWGSSLPTLESINEESQRIPGFGITDVPPTIFPLQLQRRWFIWTTEDTLFFYVNHIEPCSFSVQDEANGKRS